jgi:hypothetical protein
LALSHYLVEPTLEENGPPPPLVRPPGLHPGSPPPGRPGRRGRQEEVQALFAVSERDSIRLLHKFGAEVQNDTLALPRSSLLAQLEAIRAGSTYAAFLRQRQGLAQQLRTDRSEKATRQFSVQPPEPRISLGKLPETITWRRSSPDEPGVFEVRYENGADLMRQLAAFLAAAGGHKEEFLAGTEPPES